MLKRQDRFSFRRGVPRQKLFTPHFILRYQTTQDAGKFAIVAGKTVSKKAVERNRVKRVFVEALKTFIKDKTVSYDMVFYLKKEMLEITQVEIQKELREAFSKLHI